MRCGIKGNPVRHPEPRTIGTNKLDSGSRRGNNLCMFDNIGDMISMVESFEIPHQVRNDATVDRFEPKLNRATRDY
jgi:hypothetical protein